MRHTPFGKLKSEEARQANYLYSGAGLSISLAVVLRQRVRSKGSLCGRVTRGGSGTLRGLFKALEAIAGIPHKQGRALYGLRRQATDLAPEFVNDARVLNRISGHTDSATRERIYQDHEWVRAKAAEARRRMRAFLAEPERGEKKAA